ncbi:pilus assembly protein TadF [Aggregatibacter aphrophilus]|jgi:tadF|uniref:tight adherence pilus pseudopilin TadF n=1 Tax=Aggregatibacter kilianii TaxID=2025884 RepID=UPI000DADE698|nr:tight adherence pilus pseudopilin TadF [Aggregatibacter kilianii]RDF01600.1 pilus assembly protein TadF [Aggregatibacter aphrophilus]
MKENLLSKIKDFLPNKRGSVTIEFIFMLILLTFIFAFLADFVIVRSTQGKLDNASYSLVNVLRERIQLFGDNGTATLTDDDLHDFEKVARGLLYGDKNDDNQKVLIVLEHFWREPGSTSNKFERLPSSSNGCEPYRKIEELVHLSPNSEINDGRKIPLYQVTLCAETNSFFKSLYLSKENQSLGLIRSSSLAVSR